MTSIAYVNSLPQNPEHSRREDGAWEQVWAKTGSGYVRLTEADTIISVAETQVDVGLTELLVREGWEPVDAPMRINGAAEPWPDEWHLTWSRVWDYWITTPKSEIEGIRAFAATAEAGTVPPDWSERAATDGSTDYVVCTFSLTMDEARALGSAQTALKWGGGVPDGVHFFQRVSAIDGFAGIKKESRQPTALDTALYEQQDLFQTSDPGAADLRGNAFTESDVLEITGLKLT